MTTDYPTFAGGQVALAFLNLIDHFNNSDGSEALERAMAAAHRAVGLAPESARAHQILMNVLYARGDPITALAAGEKAVASIGNDTIVLTSYGIRLLWTGKTDQAMTLLRLAAEYGPRQPQFLYFALFMGAYIGGDDAEAARYAHLMAERPLCLRAGRPRRRRHASRRSRARQGCRPQACSIEPGLAPKYAARDRALRRPVRGRDAHGGTTSSPPD